MSIFSQDPAREQLNGMGGPEDVNPTNSGVPLVENGNPAWNPFLEHVPVEKRAEVVPLLQEWDKNYNKLNEEYEPWKEFSKSGLDPDTINTAVGVFNLLEANPQAVYESLGKALGVTPKEAKEAVEELEETSENKGFSLENDPRFKTMEQQLQAVSQILIAQREQEQLSQQEQEQEKQLDAEMTALKKQYGEFPENEIIMRMMHMDMSAEEAFKDFQNFASQFKQQRPAPFVLGGGAGAIPKPSMDVKSLDDKGRKDLVAQVLRHANQER